MWVRRHAPICYGIALGTDLVTCEGSTNLKHLIAAAALALALIPGVASALSFNGTFGVSGSALSDPGLVVKTHPGTGPFWFDLDVGQSKTVKLFDIWTDENSIQSDDRDPKSLDVAFNLLNPAGNGTLAGTSVANGYVLQYGSVDWNNPLKLSFGKGGILSVVLNDATFNGGIFGLDEGWKNGATIKATFTYDQSPSAVPLPAGLGLIAAGMGALGVAARRRKAA